MKLTRHISKLLVIFAALVLLSTAATIGIGNYFVTYAIARSGDGGNREIKADHKIELLEGNEKIIAQNQASEQDLTLKWAEQSEKEEVQIQSFDDLTLKGTAYFANEPTNKWALVLHGYRSTPDAVLSIGYHFSENGYHVLIPSMRACEDSEGDYIGMGWLDKEDVKNWIDCILSYHQDAEIVLHGSSMGGATVCMTSGETLPENVKCIISDSAYTSVYDIFASEAKARFNLPSFPVVDMFRIVGNVRAHYDIKEASALKQVKQSKTPMLFIHGDQDDFVPLAMCHELYEAAGCEKEQLIIEGAGHTQEKYRDPQKYYQAVFAFIDKYIS